MHQGNPIQQPAACLVDVIDGWVIQNLIRTFCSFLNSCQPLHSCYKIWLPAQSFQDSITCKPLGRIKQSVWVLVYYYLVDQKRYHGNNYLKPPGLASECLPGTSKPPQFRSRWMVDKEKNTVVEKIRTAVLTCLHANTV